MWEGWISMLISACKTFSSRTSFRDLNAVVQGIDQVGIQVSKGKLVNTMRKVEHYAEV